MMGSEVRVGLKHVQRQVVSMVPGTGLEPVTFGCLRHFEVYRAHSFLCRCPMSPTRHQLRHPGNSVPTYHTVFNGAAQDLHTRAALMCLQ